MLDAKPRYALDAITTVGVAMDLQFTSEEEAFRLKVRGWLAENMTTSGLSDSREGREDKTWLTRAKAWQRRLYDAGYIALAWPKEYGGQAMDPVRQSIVNDEMVRAKAPYLVGGSGLGMLGPTLISWGSEEQKQRYLPKILTAEEIWCQGYSEPGAGSDLASLKTRAEIVGDEFVVEVINLQLRRWSAISCGGVAPGMRSSPRCVLRCHPDRPGLARHAGGGVHTVIWAAAPE